jgi:integrase
VQQFLRDEAEAGRPVQGNRRRAALSACIGWLIREGHVDGLKINPCLRGAGVRRNPETKRERYVTHEEYREVWAQAGRAVRLMMALTYRTLQRPESDIIRWDRSKVVRVLDGKRVLDFEQWKTGTRVVIAMDDELEELLREPGADERAKVVEIADRRKKKVEGDPVVRRLDGGSYTYDGLSSMLKRAIIDANARRAALQKPPIESFGFRDLKGKGATDLYYIEKRPLEEIQQLIGHASKSVTEIYVKQRWREAAQPNTVRIA